MGIMASALFVGSSQMLSMKAPPVLFRQEVWLGIKDLSVLGVLGMMMSIALGLRLILAINKSGHLDREED
jgi:ubiquinone biosynthesis protein